MFSKFRSPRWVLSVLILTITSPVMGQALDQVENEKQTAGSNPLAEALDLNEDPLSMEEHQLAEAFSQKVSSTEWLGALAPVALSPFFGLTCLSGISIMGQDRLPEDHYLRNASTPLRNPIVFLAFLVLTVLTSVPKFSKVSKPFAQAVDQLEAYSAIIILLVIRFLGSMDTGESQVAVVYHAGIFEFTAESLLWIATAINILVINTVKFFFEVLIWVTPVPMIDAMFEAANKGVCAILMAIYAFSPTIACVINLLLLACCLLVFCWVKRREVYYRVILLDFFKGFLKSSTLPEQPCLTVFPQQAVDRIPALSRCELTVVDGGWQLCARRWLRAPLVTKLTMSSGRPTIVSGLLSNKLVLAGIDYKFGRAHNHQMDKLSAQLGADCQAVIGDVKPRGDLSAELA